MAIRTERACQHRRRSLVIGDDRQGGVIARAGDWKCQRQRPQGLLARKIDVDRFADRLQHQSCVGRDRLQHRCARFL